MRPTRKRIQKVKPEYNENGEQIYCVCKDVDDGSMMVGCDHCHQWFHERCIDYNGSLEYSCDSCTKILESNESEHEKVEAAVAIPGKRKLSEEEKLESETAKKQKSGDQKSAKLRALAQKGFQDTFTHIFSQLKESNNLGKLRELDLEDPQSFANLVEEALFEAYRLDDKPTEQYKNKFRSLQFNLKNDSNLRLRKRLFVESDDQISVEELVKLPTEDLASDHIISKAEKATQDSLKNMFKPSINTAVAEEPEEMKDNAVSSTPTPQTATSITALPIKAPNRKKSTSAGNIESLESLLGKIETPKVELNEFKAEQTINDLLHNLPAQNKEAESDSEKMNDEKNSNIQSDILQIIWHGLIKMPQVSSFEGSMSLFGGADINVLRKLFTDDTFIIQGRINSSTATKYVKTRLEQGTDIILAELIPKAGDESRFSKLNTYFVSKQRFGVVGVKKSGIKDVYLCPWKKGDPMPDVLQVLGLNESTNADRMFATIILATGYLNKLNKSAKQVKSKPESSKDQSMRGAQIPVQEINMNPASNTFPAPVDGSTIFPIIQPIQPIQPHFPLFQPQSSDGIGYNLTTYMAQPEAPVFDPKKEAEFKARLAELVEPDIIKYMKRLLAEEGEI